METKVDKILEDRGSVYGSYKEGCKFREEVMAVVDNRSPGPMHPIHRRYIDDIVNKLSRVAVTPTHRDSWVDIAGYATLVVKELDNETKKPFRVN